MKRTAVALTILLLLGMALGVTSARADSSTITLTVTIQSLALDISTTAWDLGIVTAGSTTLSSPFTVANTGNVNVDYTISVVDTATEPWTSASAIGENTFVLKHGPEPGPFVDIPTDNLLAENVTALTGTYLFRLEFTAPSSVSGTSPYDPHSLEVTITSSVYTP